MSKQCSLPSCHAEASGNRHSWHRVDTEILSVARRLPWVAVGVNFDLYLDWACWTSTDLGPGTLPRPVVSNLCQMFVVTVSLTTSTNNRLA
jgi:hypothetical protein